MVFAGAMALALVAAGWMWWFWPTPVLPPPETEAAAVVVATAGAPALPAPRAPPTLPTLPTQGGEQSLEQLLARPNDGNWHLTPLAGQAAVRVLEFPDLITQGHALNRAAALIEKGSASRERVLDDAALAALIAQGGDNTATYFLGHDYPAAGLARFYNLALAQQVALNTEEQRLRGLLVNAGLLIEGQGGLVSGAEPGALVTFSALQRDDPATRPDESVDAARRASVLRHELSHGRYFTDARYRAHCAFFWRSLLTEAERQSWRRYLADQGYDARNEDLMINETQAFLMHTPDERDFKAADLHWKDADLAALRERFQLGLK